VLSIIILKIVSKIFALKLLKPLRWQSTTTMHIQKSVSRLLTSDEIHIITNFSHLNCAEYGLQKWFNSPQKVRVRRL